MRFLIMLEQTETGFAMQIPDLAITTYGENIEAAKRAARLGRSSSGDIFIEGLRGLYQSGATSHLHPWLRDIEVEK